MTVDEMRDLAKMICRKVDLMDRQLTELRNIAEMLEEFACEQWDSEHPEIATPIDVNLLPKP